MPKKLAEPWKRNLCQNPCHRFPAQCVLQPGRYEHICPACKKRSVFMVVNRTLVA